MTNTLVLYFSQTGNTKKVAEAIFHSIQGNKEIKQLSDSINVGKYDLVFVGYPIYNFGPIKIAEEFISKYLTGRNIAVFMTMALTAAPTSDQTKELYDLTINKSLACSKESNVLGIFDCPGELSESAANALLNSKDPMLRMFGSIRYLSLGFPNENNIKEAESFAKSTYLKFLKIHSL